MRACPRCLTVYESDPEFCAFDGSRTQPLTDRSDPLEGARLDAFVLERRLGVGGTGCVYQGRDATGAPVAIKLLFGEMATDKGIAERFRREARAMQEIQHRNVVSVIDCKTSAAGLTYLAMEFVQGRTLKQVLEAEAPLAPGRVARLAEQLVAGMAQAHRIGYVHRDLKPSNVIVSGSPGAEVAKILDFGIVASLHEQEQDSRLTKTGYIVGTPTYMAPEQVDPKSVTPQADVYALGVMIYEMLAGKPPFTGTLEQILVAKMTAPPPKLEGAGELGELVMELLAIAPEDRPATALHVSAELARLSLLSADPATEKARVPDLPSLGVVGFGQATVILTDRTKDSGPSPASISMEGTAPMGVVTRAGSTSDVWVADTHLDGEPAAPEALDDETPEDPALEFGEEIPTNADLRPDTIVDVNPLDADSIPEIEPETFLDGTAPTAQAPGAAVTVEASGPVDLADAETAQTPRGDAADTDDTALLAPVDDEIDDPDTGESEIGFADTRIRPTHHPEGDAPTWAPVLGVSEPAAMVDPAEVAATTFDVSRVHVGATEDGPTSLSSLVPGPVNEDDDDPGDGDTALDFSLEDVAGSRTDLELADAAAQALGGFVDTPSPPSRPPAPASPGPRWLLPVLFTTLLLFAAALTYRVLTGSDVIEIPTTPESGATP